MEMSLLPIFELMAQRNASDIFVIANAPIIMKVDGLCGPINDQILRSEDVKQQVYQLLTVEQTKAFEKNLELNIGYSLSGTGRFRINVYQNRGSVSMVVRYIRPKAMTLSELGMPDILKDLILEKNGIILIVGSTGSGKSSTVSAMLDHRNNEHSGHILMIEDPIEYLHSHKKSVISQREIGIDTHTYGDALKNAMREAPDVLMLGEIRDQETMNYAMQYAQTGHLCISTLHANNSYHSLSRIVNFFPKEAREALLYDLSISLKAIISQRLIRNKQNLLCPALEMMINTSHISELIRSGVFSEIREAMEKTLTEGAVTFDQSLYRMYCEGEVELNEALRHADSATNLLWMVNNAQTKKEGGKMSHLSASSDSGAIHFDIPLR